ncbi:MAG TPA: alginate export family protein [Chitinophagaceae bacterium]|nr:alginate export family protein [Chitinophagaceae bacterium]MCC6634436.1 alginate export family protein [Chitinophagaceae bacterium]HMZ46128.1 alginate export family protein [Chitinophagaceae bacterium]HNJ58284.1 alginate export family protein [Chitinophagaceae bacterium]HNL82050.1 alginate export family protein [Chitinophagaceae bacterium]
MNISSSAKIDLKSSVLIIFSLIFSFSAISQTTDSSVNNLKVQIQFRPKLEVRDGAFRPLAKKEEPAVLVSERIRLNINYSYKNIFTLKISPQTVGIWGQANAVQGVENSGNKIALFEAWTNFNLSNTWNIKLGRQVISLDDERFFGELDWAQGGRTHDALSFLYKKNNVNVKSYFAFNQNYKSLYNNNSYNPAGNLYNSNDAVPYKTMQTLWVGFNANAISTFSFLFTNIGLQQAANLNNTNAAVHQSQTFGINYFNAGKTTFGNLSAYWQTGKNIAGTKTQAFLLAGSIGYKFSNKTKIMVGTDWVSGNDIGQAKPPTTNNAFTPYFHTGHKFYGNMDYYFAGNGHQNAGLSDSYLNLQCTPTKKLNATIAVHQFYTTNKISSQLKNYSKNLGQELDFSLQYKPNSFTSLSCGYSFYVTTPTIHYLKNTTGSKDYQQWLWLSLNVTPTLLISKF